VPGRGDVLRGKDRCAAGSRALPAGHRRSARLAAGRRRPGEGLSMPGTGTGDCRTAGRTRSAGQARPSDRPLGVAARWPRLAARSRTRACPAARQPRTALPAGPAGRSRPRDPRARPSRRRPRTDRPGSRAAAGRNRPGGLPPPDPGTGQRTRRCRPRREPRSRRTGPHRAPGARRRAALGNRPGRAPPGAPGGPLPTTGEQAFGPVAGAAIEFPERAADRFPAGR
jgi:hypothetical protein